MIYVSDELGIYIAFILNSMAIGFNPFMESPLTIVFNFCLALQPEQKNKFMQPSKWLLKITYWSKRLDYI